MLEVNGNAKATKFIGPLQGNADTATKATQDANGDVIADTYVKKTQLKTINSQSLLGEGNIEIQVEGGGITDAPSDNKLYGRKNAQWTEVTVPDTSNFATKTDLDDYLPLTGGWLQNFFDISDFFTLTAGSGHNNNSKVVSFPIQTSSNTLCEMVAYADNNVSMVSGSLKIGYNNFNDPGVGFSGDDPGILMDINQADPRIALDVTSAGQYSLSIGKGGITIPSKTSSDLLHAAGGTVSIQDIISQVSVPTKVSELTNDSGFQTEAQVSAKISALVDSAPETLDTLNELAAALGDDPNFATTIITQLGNKLDASTYNSDKATFALKSELPSVESITTTDINALFS